MIVCLCKVLSEDDIYTAIEKGATNAKKVHAALKPELVRRPCAPCVAFITQMVREGRPSTSLKTEQTEHAGCCGEKKEQERK